MWNILSNAVDAIVDTVHSTLFCNAIFCPRVYDPLVCVPRGRVIHALSSNARVYTCIYLAIPLYRVMCSCLCLMVCAFYCVSVNVPLVMTKKVSTNARGLQSCVLWVCAGRALKLIFLIRTRSMYICMLSKWQKCPLFTAVVVVSRSQLNLLYATSEQMYLRYFISSIVRLRPLECIQSFMPFGQTGRYCSTP